MLAATLEYDQNILTRELLDLLQAWKNTQDDVVLHPGVVRHRTDRVPSWHSVAGTASNGSSVGSTQ
jgi:hypothetical protein